jgi:hypothetical protein
MEQFIAKNGRAIEKVPSEVVIHRSVVCVRVCWCGVILHVARQGARQPESDDLQCPWP